MISFQTRLIGVVVGAAFLFGPLTSPLYAQLQTSPFSMRGGGQLSCPSAKYYFYFPEFYDGDYKDALRGFQSEARSSIKTTESRWIDSICYETMCGECYYQTGNLREALDRYTAALTLFLHFSNWMTQVQFPSALTPVTAGVRRGVPWGASARNVQLAAFPTTMLMRQGQVDQSNVIQSGGVLRQANLSSVTPQEIVRCTTLALRRRAMLLGPIAKYDPLTSELVGALSRNIGPPNHWSECWVNLERGLVLLAAGQETQGVNNLQRAVLAAGAFDHPLSCVALLELGRYALGRGEYDKAARFFAEAGYASMYYETNTVCDYGVLEESLRYGALTHLLANRKGLYPPLEKALQWAKVKNLRQLRASLLLCAAENLAVLGDVSQAAAMLDDARITIGRRTMAEGWLGARLNYLSAQVFFQQKKIAEGNAALAAAMQNQRTGSLWLFQIVLVDEMYMRGAATQRTAVDLFGTVLRDPDAADWTRQPEESLAVLLTPHPLPYEHWFEAAFQRKDMPGALEVAERVRRHRFFTSLDFGGRLESLRWLLAAPSAALPEKTRLQRQDIITRYPAYAELSRRTQAVRDELTRMPLVETEQNAQRRQEQKLRELAAMSLEQEAILREIAVRREPAALLFPPLRSVADVQKALPAKHAALVFFTTANRWYGFLLNNERIGGWASAPSPALFKQTTAFLRECGQYQQNHALPVKELSSDKWKQTAKQTLDAVLRNSPADFSHPFEELVIVPDGLLWYLPFEALQVSVKGELQSLVSRFRIRYAPTLSLAAPFDARYRPPGNVAVAVGRLYPRDDEAVAQAAFRQLADVAPHAVALRAPPPAPTSLYRVLFGQLIVLDDLTVSPQDPYGWCPVPLDRGKPGSTLADWLRLPWGGPDVIVLPGYHTAAEDGLKRINRDRPGNEVFLSVCGLMANGAHTILLSRWRTGGQTSFDLVREFVQELPNMSPAESWQRAVTLQADTRLDLTAEPRVKHGPEDAAPKAKQPFFWAGYMLVDCGASAGRAGDDSEQAAAVPVIQPAAANPAKPADDPKPAAP